MDETSLVFSNPGALRWEHFERIANSILAPIGRGYPWWVGDLLNVAEEVLGEEWTQLEKLLPSSPQTQANYKSVAKHVPRSRRRGLHLSTVEPVAYWKPKERDEMLARAVAEDWKREEMREAARAVRQGLPIKAAPGDLLPPPPKKICPNCGHAIEE